MPFEPGKSGNPGGRPRVAAEIRDLARVHTPAAIKTLVAMMNNKKAPPAARVAASNSLLDRGYGKPTAYTSTEANPFDRYTDAERRELLEVLEAYDADRARLGESGSPTTH